MDTRREFLKKAMLLSGATGVANVIPLSIQKALAINPQTGSSYLDAEHVVILMQENRSFDHCFGTLRGVRGFNDPRTITLPDKNRVWLQSNKAGETYTPFRFDIRDTKITWMGDIPHTRSSQVDAFNMGKYDKWLDAKRSPNKQFADMPLTLGHYTREDIPFNYALADGFTICDQHFSSAMTSTWPNRLYLWGGTIRKEKSSDARAYIRNAIPYGEANWKTFPEQLEENDISWKVYQNETSSGGGFVGEERSWLANFGCNPLEHLAQYNARFSSRYYQTLQERAERLSGEISELESKVAQLSSADKALEKLKKDIEKKKEVLNETKEELVRWNKDNFDKLSQMKRNLYRKAFTTNEGDPDYLTLSTLRYEENGTERELPIPKGDILFQFRKDVDTGKLPTVSWLVPPQNFSDHPSAPWYGAWYTSEVLDILTKNPEVWKKTIFILTYDENDGYFDHVPPFTAPDSADAETGKCSESIKVNGEEFVYREQELQEGIPKGEARSGPIGLGFRVPMIIASPWSRGGKVCSQVFDHTSVLQFLEEFLNKKFGKGIKQETISDWRRAVCGNLTSAFSLYAGEKPGKLPALSKEPFIEKIYNAKFKKEPSGFKKLSADEIAMINRDPSSSPLMTRQENGIRPSRPLPYQLYADGKLSADKKSFEVAMRSADKIFDKQSAGSPFTIYAPGKYFLPGKSGVPENFESARAWQYAVASGDFLKDAWPLSSFENENYHLRVYGPNGFFREFIGNKNDPLLEIGCDYQHSRIFKNNLSGNVELKIKNASRNTPYPLEVIDQSYGNKPIHKMINPSGGEIILLDLKRSFGWYDFMVHIKGSTVFSKRFAGRVETGKESFSDPAMGKIKI